MKYIGTVVDDAYAIRDNRTEVLVRIEGLDRPQTIALFWSHDRSPQALTDLTAGTKIIFAARDDTLAQRTHTDDDTGMTSTILVALGKFYDLLADDVDVDWVYESIAAQDIELTGVVTAVRHTPAKKNRPQLTSLTLAAPRHGRLLPFQTRWYGDLAAPVRNVSVGDTVTACIDERSLSWCVDVTDNGLRSILPAGTATGIAQWDKADLTDDA